MREGKENCDRVYAFIPRGFDRSSNPSVRPCSFGRRSAASLWLIGIRPDWGSFVRRSPRQTSCYTLACQRDLQAFASRISRQSPNTHPSSTMTIRIILQTCAIVFSPWEIVASRSVCLGSLHRNKGVAPHDRPPQATRAKEILHDGCADLPRIQRVVHHEKVSRTLIHSLGI